MRWQSDVVSQHHEVLGGVAVFTGTRVPVRNLIDYLAEGASIDAFLDDFPTVRRDQVVAFLDAIVDPLYEDLD